jgi:hypothetical protein
MARFLVSWLCGSRLSVFGLSLDAAAQFDHAFVEVVLVGIDPELPRTGDFYRS